MWWVWESQGRGSSAWLEVSFVSRRSLLSSHGCWEQAHSLKQLLTFLRLQFHPESLARTHWGPTEERISYTKVTPHTEQRASSDRQGDSPHMAPKHSNHILQSLVPVLCTAIVLLDPEFHPLLWIPFHWPISDSRSSIRNQRCRSATIISEYWKIRTLKTNSWLTQALSLCQKYWQSQDLTGGSVTVLDAFL